MYILYDKTSTWEIDYIFRTLLPPEIVANAANAAHMLLEPAELVNLATLPQAHPYIGNNILIFSSNTFPYHVIVPIIMHIRPKVVIHLSDEWGRTPEFNDIAYCTKLYFRQYHHANYDIATESGGPAPIQIPLGYMSGASATGDLKPAAARKYPWSFIGNMKHDRQTMVSTFTALISGGVIRNGLSPEAMHDIYRESIFVPSGRGNVTLDCFRIYEAIIAGAIPVIVGTDEEVRATFEYGGDVPPFITAHTWDAAATRCKKMLEDTPALEKMQRDLQAWWNKQLESVQQKIRTIE